MSQTMALPLDEMMFAQPDTLVGSAAKGSVARIEAIDAHDSFGGNDQQVSQRLKELGFCPAPLRVIGFGLFAMIRLRYISTAPNLRCDAEARKIRPASPPTQA